MEALLTKVVNIRNAGYTVNVSIERSSTRMINSRQPTSILYVRYSSRSWGASLFRGSCRDVSLFQILTPNLDTPKLSHE